MSPYRHVLLVGKLLLLFVLCFVAIRNVVVRQPYGEFQTFWDDNLAYWTREVPLEHRGSPSCVVPACHAVVGALWSGSRHKVVSCETCHGVDLGDGTPRTIECMTCHRPLKARPASFPQVSPKAHHPERACLGCHDPHAPIPLMGHPMPAARQERDSCLICHLRSSEVLPEVPLGGSSLVLGRLFRPPKIGFEHGGKKFCISCHTDSPSLAELATVVHGQDVSYCPKCHREGGLAGSDFR